MKEPYDWAPLILPIQIIRIRQMVILCVSGEFTILAGRCLCDTVRTVFTSNCNGEFGTDVHIVIAGLSNSYSQYVATFEEYQIQRYEEASTPYGSHSHTVRAFRTFKKLAAALVGGQMVPAGPQPPDLLDQQISLLPPVIVDATPHHLSFGDVSTDIPQNSTFKRGDVVTATFWSMTEGYIRPCGVLKRIGIMHGFELMMTMVSTIEWRIPETVVSGLYRIRHFGASIEFVWVH